MSGKTSRLVYSTSATATARLSSSAGATASEPSRSLPAAEQEVRVRREKVGHGGKEVTVAGPLVLTRADAAALLQGLKRRYGSGGGLRPAQTRAGLPCFDLELQGDHADRLLADLLAAGYRARRAGG
jgi:translation initiation factor 1